MAAQQITTTCCIAGGGPAGMMLGFLLARAGVEAVVLEKHADFLRDFRGDTIHPSTLEVIYELGLLDKFLALPHQKARGINAQFGDLSFPFADFTHLPTHCRFVAFMPQWDFLDFVAGEARRYPGFRLLMEADVTALMENGGRIVGVTATTPDGPLEIRARLVVGADGRHSTVREKAGLASDALGAPMDVLWFRLSRRAGDPEEPVGRFDSGHIFIMINRTEQWQCGFVIPKGSLEELRAKGLDDFRATIARLVSFVGDRADEVTSWDDVKLLTVAVDRLRQWYRPGLLCIGDAAHAMSPIGGVGINLAIQDAVASANLLAEPLRRGPVTEADLAAVQKRREFPTRVTQRLQLFVQDRVVTRVLAGTGPLAPPLAVRLIARFPWLRRLPARIVGLGVRPEHVRLPEAAPASPGAISSSPSSAT
jgi:2-polyprenyl-6-methoxyphenol hydroxylase-like FAD-dependent oxidoreductase